LEKPGASVDDESDEDLEFVRLAQNLKWRRNPPESCEPASPMRFPFLNRRFEPQLDQPQHVPIDDPTRHRLHKIGM
jgi:hypothetical protein